MARGKGKHRGGGVKKNNNRKHDNSSSSKFKQKAPFKRNSSHLKGAGEEHRGQNARHFKRHRNNDDTCEVKTDQPSLSSDNDSDIEDEPHDHFKHLLSTFSSSNRKINTEAIESNESSDSDDGKINRDLDLKGFIHETDSDTSEDELEESNKNEDKIDDANVVKEDSGTNASERDVTESCSDDDNGDCEEDDVIDVEDHFVRHFQYDMTDSLYEAVSKDSPTSKTHQLSWPILGNMSVILPEVFPTSENVKKTAAKVTITEEKQFAEPGAIPCRITDINWKQLHLRAQIEANITKANSVNIKKVTSEPLSPLQRELFSVMNCYQDLYFPGRTLENCEEIRFTYCLHAVNHVLKTRNRIVRHNARLSKKLDVPEEYRDQGLVRPKVVIMVPFRDSALRVVKMIMAIFFKDEDKANVVNLKRFIEEHTGDEIAMPQRNRRPEDYEATFSGNTDDTFRIGLTVNRNSIKLYADFYSADIIVASPLGLRVIVGADGESERDFDFLASVELLVLDQTELFLMQNWDHLLHVLDHFHLQPKESHGTDFSRVRSWALNGWARYYRQTLVISALGLPEINSLCNRKCHNYAGKIMISNPVSSGAICQVVVQLPQVFHQFAVDSPAEAIDARFNFFVKKILPQYKDSITNHVMIYVPSYFDYVHLRNYLKREDLSFVQICEYSKDSKVARARDMFFHDDAHFLLYSERFHFFRRPRVKGIRHLIFYQPPTFPHLYAEMCNLMLEANQNKWAGGEGNSSVAVVYCKYDAHRLAGVVGTERARKMLASERNVHMFTTAE